MHQLDISYKTAVEGGYAKRATSIPDPFGRYFAERGATVHHSHFYAPDITFGDNHLINIINLIYYVKKKGYAKLELSLDYSDTYKVIKDKFYLISSLPEVLARIFDRNDGQKTLEVTYDDNFKSLIESQLAGMSSEDIDQMINATHNKEGIDALMPIEIIKKYNC